MILTDEARYKAGKSQMGTFLSNQYLMWRIVSAKSIRKIILTADEFYTDILPEEITQDEDVVNTKFVMVGCMRRWHRVSRQLRTCFRY